MQLHAVVSENPGILKSHVERFVPYAPSTVHYHLGVLIRGGDIRVYEPAAKKKHLFNAQVDPAEFAAIAAMRMDFSEVIMKEIQEAGSPQLYQLDRNLPVSRKVIANHLDVLEFSELVHKEGLERAKYSVTDRFKELFSQSR